MWSSFNRKIYLYKAYDAYNTNISLNRSHETWCFTSSSMGRSSINNWSL